MRLRTLVTPVLAFGVTLAAAVPAAAVPAAAVPAGAHGQHAPSWQLRPTGSSHQFRGLAAVSRNVAWLAGTNGTVLRTSDGGRHWRDVSPAAASTLEFRDIEAWDSRHAVALTIGEGPDSAVFRTSDGGASWQKAFTNDDPAAFYDCLAFFNRRDGLALSDPVDGKFRLIATHDGGRTWSVAPSAGMPAAQPGEFAFAASGTCLVASGHDAWIATGGAATARVFHSRDMGRHWTVADTPVVVGPSAGIYSLAVSGHRRVEAVGGDFQAPTARVDVAASSRDGGRSWRLASIMTGGYRSGVAFTGGNSLVAVGPTGSDYSRDGGRTWTAFDTGDFDGVQRAGDGTVWASGPDGRAARLI